MAHWNYRVVKQHSDIDSDCVLREVYYNSEGKIINWSGPIRLYGSSAQELSEEVDKAKQAFTLPTLVLYYNEDTGRETLVEEQ